MTLVDFWNIIRRHIITTLVVWTLLVAITCIVAIQKPPMYTASAQYYVTLPAAAGQINPTDGTGITDSTHILDSNSVQDGNNLSQNRISNADKIKATQDFVKSQLPMLSTLVTTDIVLKPVAEQYMTDTSLTTLKKRTKLSIQENTVLVTIQVQDENPTRAANLANAVGTSLNKALAGNGFTTPPLLQSDENGISTNQEIKIAPIVLASIQQAQAPDQPSTSRKSILLIGVLAAFVIAICAAVLKEVIERHVREVDDVTRITNVSNLAIVQESSHFDGKPVVISAPEISVSENIRRLASNIAFITPKNAALSNVIVVTSAGTGEGKSTIASNLAAAFAESDENVLLIDTDLRNPNVAQNLGIHGENGLTQLITGQLKTEDVIQHYWKPNFHVLPAGERIANPSAIINSRAMRAMVEQMAQHYSFVVIDSASLSVANSAEIFANMGALLLLVTARDVTLKQQLQRTVRELEVVHLKVAGTVFNCAKQQKASTSYSENSREGKNKHAHLSKSRFSRNVSRKTK